MDVGAAMLVEGRRQARVCEAFGGNARTRESEWLGHTTLGTPPGPNDRGFVIAIASVKLQIKHRKIAFTSSGASVCGRRDRPIRKNIIGHRMPAFRRGRTGGSGFLRLRRPLPLLHQPPREHGRRTFLKPLVEKRPDFFAEIGGVIEAGEFKALQRVARGREKELPRRFGFLKGHAGLLEERLLTLAFRKKESRVPIG